MIWHDLVLAGPEIDLSRPKGSAFDVLMLQAHVISASIWMVSAVLVAFMAVPRLRRVPSALGLHLLQTKRELVLSALWGTYSLALSTGIFLLVKQAAYDPPLSGKDWDTLKGLPYGVPYYYALYGKIIIFLLMGLASLSLSSKARRASKASEAAGGPVDEDLTSEDDEWLDEEVIPSGFDAAAVYAENAYSSTTRTQQRSAQFAPVTGGWISVATLMLGAVGIAVCVGLIKYFHELSKAALLYYRLTHPGT